MFSGMTGRDVLLCESCGYDLTGSPPSSSCPECGRPVADSLPERRTGTPWQLRRGPSPWIRTLVLILTKPRAVWESVSISGSGGWSLLLVNAVVAGLVPAVALLFPAPIQPRAHLGYAVMFAFWFAMMIVLLTLIEAYGIRFFGRRRRWRTTREVASVVCAHASYGWLVSGVLVAAAWHGSPYMSPAFLASVVRLFTGGASRIDPGHVHVLFMFASVTGGFLIGLVVFEMLVYTGFVRLRYANRGGGGLVEAV